MTDPASAAVGDEVTLEIGAVAHGGHCVARWAGRVVFVRHALPGERAVVRLTDTSHAGYLRGDAVEILAADPRRVPAPCQHFRPGGCGGCDFQHADAQLQRELKSAVISEQLSRLAGIDRVVEVEQVSPELGWRTRVRWALDSQGRIGPRGARSHEVMAVSGNAPCVIAAQGLSDAVDTLDVPARVRSRGRSAPQVPRRGRSGRRSGSALPEVTLLATPAQPLAVWAGDSSPEVIEVLRGRRFAVAADGFWQVHPHAAQTLTDAVHQALGTTQGTSAWDLYGGVGLFAAVLAEWVGADGTVLTVESDRAASAFAQANLADLPQVRVHSGRVEQVLADLPESADAIVLDPPRSGAGRVVCEAMADRRPAVIVYVACDPAALARDTATLAEHGYALQTLRAFDLFPQTHHVECVASFGPIGSS